MKISFTRRAAAAFALALCSLAASNLPTLAQSRRTPPQEPQKRNTRPDETKQTQPTEQQTPEPVPPDAIKSDEVVKVSSNIVQIEAVVINKKTKQIMTGLKQQNFQVFEDGVQKDVTNF